MAAPFIVTQILGLLGPLKPSNEARWWLRAQTLEFGSSIY